MDSDDVVKPDATAKPENKAPEVAETLEAALGYLRESFRPIPIPLGRKGPKSKGWQKLRLDEAGLRQAFGQEPRNIGLLLGEPSGGLVDVDLDCPEAIRLAPEFLPPTARRSGRAGKPESHWWYVCQGATSKKFQDPGGGMLVELRSTGGQTVVPPSVHPEGERYVWHEEGPPAAADAEALENAVRHLAAASLLAGNWPGQGSRHKAALAVAGLLLRGGLDLELVKKLVGAAARAAGDEEVEDRMRAVETTAERVRAGETATDRRHLFLRLSGD
jgi:hypothetical protein